jgi:hypothetical protein
MKIEGLQDLEETVNLIISDGVLRANHLLDGLLQNLLALCLRIRCKLSVALSGIHYDAKVLHEICEKCLIIEFHS